MHTPTTVLTFCDHEGTTKVYRGSRDEEVEDFLWLADARGEPGYFRVQAREEGEPTQLKLEALRQPSWLPRISGEAVYDYEPFEPHGRWADWAYQEIEDLLTVLSYGHKYEVEMRGFAVGHAALEIAREANSPNDNLSKAEAILGLVYDVAHAIDMLWELPEDHAVSQAFETIMNVAAAAIEGPKLVPSG